MNPTTEDKGKEKKKKEEERNFFEKQTETKPEILRVLRSGNAGSMISM